MTSYMTVAERDAVRARLIQRYGTVGRSAARSTTAAGKAAAANAEHEAALLQSMASVMPKAATRPPFSVRILNHLTYGATKTTIAEFNALGTGDTARRLNYVDWQLDYQSIDDSAVDTRLANAGYTTLTKSLTQLWNDHVKPDPAWEVRMRPAWEAQRAALVRAVYAKRQLLETTVNFWHDHFHVNFDEYIAGPVYVHYDREVIRKHAFGNFRAMLEDVAKSTSMLYYLNNVSNSRGGPNENFARELLELHTFGAENYLGFMDPFQVPPDGDDPSYPSGYTDIDVYETASAFTGWSAKNGHWEFPTENDGTFVYRQSWHDAGPKFLLGRMLYPEQPALKDGRDVFDRLASHPRVAKFICKKLIRRFVSDIPDPVLIESAAKIFRQQWQAPDQIAQVLRHILLSSQIVNSWGKKARRPFEAIVAAMRAAGTDWTLRVGQDKSNEFMWRLGFTGHAPYQWPSPNGFPDTQTAWSGSSTYAMTWRMLNWLPEASDGGAPLVPVLATTRSGLAAPWTATKLVDFWSLRLLGYLPSAERRQTLINFMAQNGDAAAYTITDTNTWAGSDLKRHYNQDRIRSMVSLILMSPEFLSR